MGSAMLNDEGFNSVRSGLILSRAVRTQEDSTYFVLFRVFSWMVFRHLPEEQSRKSHETNGAGIAFEHACRYHLKD